jgi:hypothetical protein
MKERKSLEMEGVNGREDMDQMEQREDTGLHTSFQTRILPSIFMAKWWKYVRYENGKK